jgi:hypothetical protein
MFPPVEIQWLTHLADAVIARETADALASEGDDSDQDS